MKAEATGHPSLSERERQLLQLAAKGLTDQGIANKLGISLATVGTYWGRIRIKLGPLNRTELVANYLKEQAGHVVSDLREENSRLAAEIDRRNTIEQEMQNVLDVLESMVNAAPDAILLIDTEGRIRLCNQAAAELFGYPLDELRRTPISDLLPARFRADHTKYRASYFGSPQRKEMGEHAATPALHKEGHEFNIAATLNGVRTASGQFAVCMIRSVV